MGPLWRLAASASIARTASARGREGSALSALSLTGAPAMAPGAAGFVTTGKSSLWSISALREGCACRPWISLDRWAAGCGSCPTAMAICRETGNRSCAPAGCRSSRTTNCRCGHVTRSRGRLARPSCGARAARALVGASACSLFGSPFQHLIEEGCGPFDSISLGFFGVVVVARPVAIKSGVLLMTRGRYLAAFRA